MRPLISVVSPVYGCTGCLEALADAVRAAFDGTELDWELVLVDDRGPDAPWPVIEDLSARDPRVRGVRLARNHGQHLAIWAGLDAARGDWVAVIDCDLQDDPAVIPDLYAKAIADQVEGVVVERGKWSDNRFRRFASDTFYKVFHALSGVRLKNIGNFGLYSRRMVDVLLMYEEQEVFLPIMVSISGLSTSEMRLDRGDRHSGESSYSLGRLISLSLAVVIRFSDRPLKISVVFGLCISFLAAIVSITLFVGRIVGTFTVPGWTSTVLSMWFLSGLILAVLGVHGFYLGRVFAEVKRRPRLLVERTTDAGDPDGAALGAPKHAAAE